MNRKKILAVQNKYDEFLKDKKSKKKLCEIFYISLPTLNKYLKINFKNEQNKFFTAQQKTLFP